MPLLDGCWPDRIDGDGNVGAGYVDGSHDRATALGVYRHRLGRVGTTGRNVRRRPSDCDSHECRETRPVRHRRDQRLYGCLDGRGRHDDRLVGRIRACRCISGRAAKCQVFPGGGRRRATGLPRRRRHAGIATLRG
ncbi:hypothetical protein G6F59_017796 [Rhizopus arrhizus]|nr:hypothetical protein G6F59_017796 [Rhizopus arrhizus]